MYHERVAEFYDGKSVLITGAAGFLGSFLLEILLRCCPGLKSVYIVLREKKGVSPDDRKQAIFDKLIFSKVKEQNPSALEKVRVVAGDTTLPDLGMREEDLRDIISDVTVVFHAAASVQFSKTITYIMSQNVKPIQYVVDICRKLQKLDVLVYSSTAYCNTNKPLKTIEEMVYKLPYTGERILKEIDSGDDRSLEYLQAQCGKPWPNNYCFSKCAAETVLVDIAGDLPISIVRPSIIASSWKEPVVGYAEDNSAIVMMATGVGKGFIRVIQGDPDNTFDFTPADVVCNAHILASFKVATGRTPSGLVVNCASRKADRHTFGEFTQIMMELVAKYPVPNGYQRPSLVLRTSTLGYWWTSILEHYAPALVIDTLLKISGKKPKLYRLYRFVDNARKHTRYFITHDWEQEVDNFKALADGLHPEDQETFFVDQAEYRIQELVDDIPAAMPIFAAKDRREPKERERVLRMRSLFTFLIKCCVQALAGLLLYTILSQLGKLAGVF